MHRILVISNLYPSKEDPTFGTFVKNFTDDISDYMPNVIVEKCVIRGRSKSNLGKIYKYIIFYFVSLCKLLFTKYDLVYVHYISHSIPPVWFASKLKNIPVAFNIHGDDILVRSKQGELFLKMAGGLLRKSKMVVVPSPFFKDVLHEKFPDITDEKITISPSGGIDISFFNEDNVNRLHEGPLHLGYVSRIDTGKGWDVFINAVNLLQQEGAEIKASIIGTGEQVKEMTEIIRNNNADSYIKYLGAKAHEDLIEYYKGFDLFVFPTMLQESLGLVGLEAMAAGTPVLGTRIGGLKTYIEDGVNGFLFEKGDYKELASKIFYYLKLDSNEKVAMKRAAYEKALEYESTKVASLLYDKIIMLYDFKTREV